MRSTNKNELITVRMGNSVAAIVDMKASSEKPKNEASTIYYANSIINPTMVDDTHNRLRRLYCLKGRNRATSRIAFHCIFILLDLVLAAFFCASLQDGGAR